MSVESIPQRASVFPARAAATNASIASLPGSPDVVVVGSFTVSTVVGCGIVPPPQPASATTARNER